MKTVAIIQARMGSSRLPNKIMAAIGEHYLIEILLARLSRSKRIDQIVVATTTNDVDTPLAQHIEKLNFMCFRGSENDVLDRYVKAAREYGADVVVRITGDCPLIDPSIVDKCIKHFCTEGKDYCSTIRPPTFPDGLDVEVMSLRALEQAHVEADQLHQREHVTPYIYESGKFELSSVKNDKDLSYLRWTVDEKIDLTLVRNIFEHFAPNIQFGWEDVLALHANHPDLFAINQHIERNEGSKLGKGQKLWKRAKTVIPGGNMLLSKRAEMFLPDHWPAYYTKSKGCEVWDLDGNKFIDMSVMGIGTSLLGYCNEEVDSAVAQAVADGVASTLNCPEEVALAERLIELHSWADMARFARSGGEANSIAIRIARAASGREKVAICGYHGWHDWYLSANLNEDDNLDGHLLPGLEPNGVPRGLVGTTLPFQYNDYEGLLDLVNNNDVGVIKMEVARNTGPKDNFLQKVRRLATERNIVLIFDECTSGFRETFGGLHIKYGVEPDIAMFGKALGNGYAITAIIGRRDVMEAAQATFISSTFWTERIGPVAALATLNVMEKNRSWETVTALGKTISDRWSRLAEKCGLDVSLWGIPALSGFSFKSPNALAYKTFVTQEMLKQGYLAANSVYVSTAHTTEIIDTYFEVLDPIFCKLKECEDGRDIEQLLDGPVCHSGFQRLN